MHQASIKVILAIVAIMVVGNLASGSTEGGIIMAGVFLVFAYLAFIARSATKPIHFTIGRLVTIVGIAIATCMIFAPVIADIMGRFGDARFIVCGVIVFLPMWVFRGAIVYRKKQLSDAASSVADDEQID